MSKQKIIKILENPKKVEQNKVYSHRSKWPKEFKTVMHGASIEVLEELKAMHIKPNEGICFSINSIMKDFICDSINMNDSNRIHRLACMTSSKLQEYVTEHMQKWPKFSGNIAYPIKAPESYVSFVTIGTTVIEMEEIKPHSVNDLGSYFAPECYVYCSENLTLWKGDYGALREELLDFLIGHLKQVEL
ncbi:hypothetical protein TH1_152 [Shewanella phage Thanatos-1]|nr:hypothetical protein TH1_152 [Shewanella phage Thanatos-1]